MDDCIYQIFMDKHRAYKNSMLWAHDSTALKPEDQNPTGPNNLTVTMDPSRDEKAMPRSCPLSVTIRHCGCQLINDRGKSSWHHQHHRLTRYRPRGRDRAARHSATHPNIVSVVRIVSGLSHLALARRWRGRQTHRAENEHVPLPNLQLP
ncbi:hypothetical protein BJX62DRAFT_198251 [Aspergillus germanicus]